MKTMKKATLCLMAVFLCCGLHAQNELKEQLTVPLSDPGKPYKLNVNVMHGSIKVAGYQGKEILIDVQQDADDNSDSRQSGNGMRRIASGSGLDLSAEEKSNRVTVHSGINSRPIHLVLKVPQGGAGLKLGTINGGDIVVENVNGEMEINNTNGAIRMSGVSGSVVANTINGDIEVGFVSVDPNAPMAFSTLNGNVDVTFPANLKANMKLKSDRGEMYTDFDLAVDKAQPKVNKTSGSGMYRLSVDDWVYGKINGGGPEMMMKNMNGNIYIRKAK
jgi:hypothetical protein